MKKSIIFFICAFAVYSCGNSAPSDQDSPSSSPKSEVKEEPADDGKGIGEIKNVQLNNPLVASMVENGKSVYELKCSACHKLTDQRVVGPGWKGLTQKRKPEWIMNMILNVDVMLKEDPEALKMLKECLVRMPNQNLTPEAARDVLEFIYANDGYEVAAN